MLYATHKAGGAFGMMLAFQYMRSKGLLVEDLSPIMQLAIMYPAASFGSTLPDLRHGVARPSLGECKGENSI